MFPVIVSLDPLLQLNVAKSCPGVGHSGLYSFNDCKHDLHAIFCSGWYKYANMLVAESQAITFLVGDLCMDFDQMH